MITANAVETVFEQQKLSSIEIIDGLLSLALHDYLGLDYDTEREEISIRFMIQGYNQTKKIRIKNCTLAEIIFRLVSVATK